MPVVTKEPEPEPKVHVHKFLKQIKNMQLFVCEECDGIAIVKKV
jgi:hypothetical protein